MVPVALVREGVPAHAIWTVPVVSLLVVADHLRHHLLELEQVEARAVKVADATDHAMYFQFPLFLYH